jgi:hypothetical protein
MPAMRYASDITNKSSLGLVNNDNNIRGNHMDLWSQNCTPSHSPLEMSWAFADHTSNDILSNNFEQNLINVNTSVIPEVYGFFYNWNFYLYDMGRPFGAASDLNTTSNQVTPIDIETVGGSTALLGEIAVINPLGSTATNSQKKKRQCTHLGCGKLVLEIGFNNHQKTHDTEREKFKCVVDGCGKSYFHKRSLRKHQITQKHL